ncbi:hypothetical protein Hamer_G001039, partial [Homarus americanus]
NVTSALVLILLLGSTAGESQVGVDAQGDKGPRRGGNLIGQRRPGTFNHGLASVNHPDDTNDDKGSSSGPSPHLFSGLGTSPLPFEFSPQPVFVKTNDFPALVGFAPQGGFINPSTFGSQGGFVNPNTFGNQGVFVNPNNFGGHAGFFNPNSFGSQSGFVNPNSFGSQGVFVNPNTFGIQGSVLNPNSFGNRGGFVNPNTFGSQGNFVSPFGFNGANGFNSLGFNTDRHTAVPFNSNNNGFTNGGDSFAPSSFNSHGSTGTLSGGFPVASIHRGIPVSTFESIGGVPANRVHTGGVPAGFSSAGVAVGGFPVGVSHNSGNPVSVSHSTVSPPTFSSHNRRTQGSFSDNRGTPIGFSHSSGAPGGVTISSGTPVRGVSFGSSPRPIRLAQRGKSQGGPKHDTTTEE